jgi:plasmid stabilization system protein ParE
MRLRYRPRAVNDIIEIAGYLAERNPIAARAVELRLRAAAELLCQFPAMGRRVEQRPEVRVLPAGRFPYLIFYSVTPDEVVILHIRHGAREPASPDEL